LIYGFLSDLYSIEKYEKTGLISLQTWKWARKRKKNSCRNNNRVNYKVAYIV
jgi:ribosomal protein S30